MQKTLPLLFPLVLSLFLKPAKLPAEEGPPTLIVHGGRIVTVDKAFTIVDAMAVKGDRIVATGADKEILATRGSSTEVLNLEGRMVLPGLIDSHVHPGASMTEFDHPIPDLESIEDVLEYIKSRAEVLEDGQWIEVHQVFITRLREPRYPTRQELDAVAPNNPVLFATGPDASLNTLALKLSGIDRNFEVTDGSRGYAEKDPQTGEPSGILRACTRYVKVKPAGRKPTEEDRYRRQLELFRDYNSVGLTTIGDRAANPGDLARYQKMHESADLRVRVSCSVHIETIGALEDIQRQIRQVAEHPLRQEDPMLRVIGIKTFLDGGMLTGSAYMREPWGVSQVYSITDPTYRGVLFVPHDRLVKIVRTTAEAGLQFTAHSVGDGAVHALLDAYEAVTADLPALKETRPCITHCNFMSAEAIQKMKRLGVVADIQPPWLYLDTPTLVGQFGYDRLRYFQPLKSLFEAGVIAGGGSDHMQKIGSTRAINPYNPFLGMWITLQREARWYEGQLHPEEALSREQAIRFYTINNAYLLFCEHQIGSLEPGKLADFVVIDRDLLNCPVDDVREAKVVRTHLGGKVVYQAK